MSIKTELHQPGHTKQISGHGVTAPERYAPHTRHMVILEVITYHAGYTAGERVRLYLTDEGYNEAVQADERGGVNIIRYARVRMGELKHDAPEREQ